MRDDVKRAVEALRRGQLIGLPTETVYGLGADAMNPEAVRRIFAAKGRPESHPLIVHIAGPDELGRFARYVPAAAERLAARFWPGPLTLILTRRSGVPNEVTGGLETVGLRVPDHPLALAVLRAFGGGVAAPSANRFGRISPTTAEHVRAELGEKVAVVLDGGPCRVGVESTILALTGPRPLLLRPGAVLPAALAEVLGEEPEAPGQLDVAPRAPGTLASHYAPSTPLELCVEGRLDDRVAELIASGVRAVVLARHERPMRFGDADVPWERAPDEPGAYAHDLYARLRSLDALARDRILVETVPSAPAWSPVADRLRRAENPTLGGAGDDGL